ncbi:probable cytochrome P450 6d5 [Eupeodes corollae]|uniref:probable cytochrome P450 6d5 n=1 Tax=Eupeodes corollae TaxID=290404 RepID=UPI00248FCFAA|nr:probable cytochrome P450 6d5 [Eupeodes corollae]
MFLILFSVGLTTLIAYLTRHIYTYWQRKGFPYYNPNIPFGCLNSFRKGKRSFGMSIYDVYKNATADKFIGIYLMFRPALVIRDAELARDILVNNFNSFHDRGVYVDEVKDPFSANLFSLPGHKWKALRGKLAPFFTPVKLRAMFPTIKSIALRMVEHLDESFGRQNNEEIVVVEMKGLFSRFVTEVIGSVVFGLDIDSFKDPNNAFHKITESYRFPSMIFSIRNAAQMLCPQFEKLFIYFGFKHDHAEFMTDIVRQTVEHRENNNVIRRDIMQMLIQLRNTGEVNEDENYWKIDTSKKDDNSKSMSIESIASSAFLFYLAGYETSATAAAYAIFELAKNPEIREKLEMDIENNLERGKLTYEGMQNMKYLDMCFMETLRKYPALPLLNRQCTQDYPIPGTNKIIEKGTPIVISVLGLHRDAKYFPDPLKFDPERFLESNQNNDTKAYMPFGEGPRHCIAQQMGKLIVKVAVINILRNYNLEAVEEGEINFDALTVTINPKAGINVKLSKKII